MPVSIFGITVSDRRNRIITNTSDRFFLEIEKEIIELFDAINKHEVLLNIIIGEIDRIRFKLTKRITNAQITVTGGV
jgi:hypothetical protein